MVCDGLILDVDGTIWNTTSIVAEAWNKAIDSLFPVVKHVSAEILQTQFGKPMSVIADNLFSPLNDSEKNILINQCCVFEHEAIENNNQDITYPSVVECIEKISKKIPVYIVSNCQSGYIELVCKKLGLESFVTDYECFGNTKLFKDKNIKLLVERNNIQNPVYVGDTQGDFKACQNVNVPFVWAKYGFGKNLAGSFETISQFNELLNLLCIE